MRISDWSSDVCSSDLVPGVQPGAEFVHQREVILDQLALQLALFRVAEDVERRTAQALQLRQQAEGAQHPGAELAFLRLAGRRVGAVGQRRQVGRASWRERGCQYV